MSDQQSKLCSDKFGNKWWCLKNGLLHREDGPAIEYADGYKAWYINGKFHRIDGPAIVGLDGYKSWYLEGVLYSQVEWFNKLTPEQQYNYLWNLNE
jgi:hypothetical protein